MKTFQISFLSDDETRAFSHNTIPFQPNLLLIFGGRRILQNTSIIKNLRTAYPKAILAGCSTSGEISGTNVNDHSLSLTAVKFENTSIVYRDENIGDFENGTEAGKALALKLANKELRHVFVLSEGLHVNGTELVTGMRDNLPEGVNVTGGLAGDGADFNKTLIISNEGEVKCNIITAIGFYGDQIKIGYFDWVGRNN